MKKLIGIGVLIVIIGLAFVLGRSALRERRDEAVREQEKEQVARQRERDFQARVDDLVRRYSAVADWSKALPRNFSIRERFGQANDEPAGSNPAVLYSVDVQRALIREDHRPMLVDGWIEDVVSNAGGIEAHLGSNDIPGGLHLVLNVSNDQLGSLLGAPRSGPSDGFRSKLLRLTVRSAFVADIASVRRATSNRYAFLANGRLLDFVYVELS